MLPDASSPHDPHVRHMRRMFLHEHGSEHGSHHGRDRDGEHR